MNLLYFIIGILCGLIIAALNILVCKKEVQTNIKNFLSKKATIINTDNPIKDLEL